MTTGSTAAFDHATQAPRIGFFGLFGSGNYGNDGSLKAMLSLIHRVRPDVRLVCICDGPKRVHQTFGMEALAIRLPCPVRANRLVRKLFAILMTVPNFLRAIVHTHTLDVLIIPGTGILDDFGSGPMGVPLDVFTWCLAARLTRTPIWFTSIGAGPIVHPLSRRLMVWAAEMAQYRSYRDTNSKLFLARAGIDTRRDPVFPDLAFDLPQPDPLPVRERDEPLRVGVGVMDYWGWRDCSNSSAIHASYQAALCRLCVMLLGKGYSVRLFPGDDSDHRAIFKLKSMIETQASEPSLLFRNVLVDPAHDLTDVMRQIAATDVVIATRFHNVVCALKMGKPIISLSYAAKNVALLEQAGLGAYTQDVECFDVERLLHQLELLIVDSATLKHNIAAFNGWIRTRLLHQEELLRDRMLALQPLGVLCREAASTTLQAPSR